MWVYTNIMLPNWLGIFSRSHRRVLVNLDGATVYLDYTLRRPAVVVEHPTGKRLSIRPPDSVTEQETFNIVRRAIEEGYNYLDLVTIEGGINPTGRRIQLGFRRPAPPSKQHPEPDVTEIDFVFGAPPSHRAAEPWPWPEPPKDEEKE